MAEQELNAIDKEQAIQDRDLTLAWSSLLAHEAGRLVLWSILDKAGIGKIGAGMFPHFGNDGDILLRGKQHFGGELLDDFVYPIDPDAFYKMCKEADNREKRLIVAQEIAENEEEEDEEL